MMTYALPAAPVQFFYLLLLMMYLKYATDTLGASPSVVGMIFLVARVWDAVSDPLVGNLSDNTVSRLGRRRSWLLASAPLLFVFGIMAWAPPEGLVGWQLTAWIAVSVIGFYTAYTIFEVPHMALGAEITLESQGRSRIFGARHLLRTLGMLSAAFATQAVMDDPEGGAAVQTATIAAVIAVATLVYSVFKLPPEREDFMGRGGESPFKAMHDVLENRHARLLLFVYFIESLGAGGISMMIPFALQYVMGLPELTGRMLGFTFALSILSIPIWVALAQRFEKRRLWLGAMAMSGLGFGMLVPLGEGDWPLMMVSSLFIGLSTSCGSILGQALKAEIVDFDEYETGERKEGSYFAAWSFVGKLASGVMVAVVGFVLDNVGYVPNAAQTDDVKWWIVFLISWFPLCGYLIGSMVFLRFDLSEAEHRRIRTLLDARSARQEGD